MVLARLSVLKKNAGFSLLILMVTMLVSPYGSCVMKVHRYKVVSASVAFDDSSQEAGTAQASAKLVEEKKVILEPLCVLTIDADLSNKSGAESAAIMADVFSSTQQQAADNIRRTLLYTSGDLGWYVYSDIIPAFGKQRVPFNHSVQDVWVNLNRDQATLELLDKGYQFAKMPSDEQPSGEPLGYLYKFRTSYLLDKLTKAAENTKRSSSKVYESVLNHAEKIKAQWLAHPVIDDMIGVKLNEINLLTVEGKKNQFRDSPSSLSVSGGDLASRRPLSSNNLSQLSEDDSDLSSYLVGYEYKYFNLALGEEEVYWDLLHSRSEMVIPKRKVSTSTLDFFAASLNRQLSSGLKEGKNYVSSPAQMRRTPNSPPVSSGDGAGFSLFVPTSSGAHVGRKNSN